jgi:hypothetical protein
MLVESQIDYSVVIRNTQGESLEAAEIEFKDMG